MKKKLTIAAVSLYIAMSYVIGAWALHGPLHGIAEESRALGGIWLILSPIWSPVWFIGYLL